MPGGQQKPQGFAPATTKVELDRSAPLLHLRSCVLTLPGSSPDEPARTLEFDKEVVRIGGMDDNDIILRDDTVSRYHCRIVQDEPGYIVEDLHSTNGTYVNDVRIREAYLAPGCSIGVGKARLAFHAREEEVRIVPSSRDRCGLLIGQNSRMREIYAILEKISPSAATVVIEGETGTGKEVVAQTIHGLSPRAERELIVFDCGAVPPNLLESELFGHEKGSFTGAIMTRRGLFEAADGGTIFLDEIGELPLELQPKLLRSIERREIRRVGATKPIKVDVRILAATNRNLKDEVKAGRFREDLYYRLSVVRLPLPALRERRDDVPLLAQHILDTASYNRDAGGQPHLRGISPEALEALCAYDWPGNVRELVNVIERAVSFCDGDVIGLGDLPEPLSSMAGAPAMSAFDMVRPPDSVAEAMDDELVAFKDAKEQWVSRFERDYIVLLLKRYKGNISHAAREADIDRKYFRKLMKKHDIEAAVGVEDD